MAVFYGLRGNRRQIVIDRKAEGRKTIMLDLGYWGRIDGGKLDGYHRIAVDGWHGWSGLSSLSMPKNRLSRFHVEPIPQRKRGSHVVLFGQSEKAAWVYGMAPEWWEVQTIEALKRHTDREIVYVPKHTWPQRRPLYGTRYHDAPADELVADAWATVSHHSNNSLWGLVKGVPTFCEDGIAKPLAFGDLSQIENPQQPAPEDVQKLCANAAYMQWQPVEMSVGEMWRTISDMGVLT